MWKARRQVGQNSAACYAPCYEGATTDDRHLPIGLRSPFQPLPLAYGEPSTMAGANSTDVRTWTLGRLEPPLDRPVSDKKDAAIPETLHQESEAHEPSECSPLPTWGDTDM